MWSFSKKVEEPAAPPRLFFILTYQKVDFFIKSAVFLRNVPKCCQKAFWWIQIDQEGEAP